MIGISVDELQAFSSASVNDLTKCLSCAYLHMNSVSYVFRAQHILTDSCMILWLLFNYHYD